MVHTGGEDFAEVRAFSAGQEKIPLGGAGAQRSEHIRGEIWSVLLCWVYPELEGGVCGHGSSASCRLPKPEA